ncbi:NEL-type E3 ubiquitin ligase domain-containing protein [Pseudomonas sp. Hg5Tf]|uniref:RING-type E3 ubiquitin transferase n=1 Tax=Pseudomonas sp. Hg7Tf TaxID=3236988 RepID=A0AB39HX89_9PSED|nr:NEL-type E3 ubiquitin ligase domain-containing protein [Pseudomonas sp. Hg5Tf]MDH2560288.1 NEL-type E3 ubiquitin ligase domain-containing protein [Pseudomonas sp. Hg5Tf]
MKNLATPPDRAATAPDEIIPHAQRIITSKVPDWLSNATPATLKQLRVSGKTPAPWFEAACLADPQMARMLVQEYELHRKYEAEVQALLNPLPELQPFATQMLTQALRERFNLDLDVSRTYLINASKAAAYKLSLNGDPIADGQRALKLATQSLLHCAMQNFEASEAQPGGLDEDQLPSVIVDSDQFLFVKPTGNPVALAPDAFAALSRDLDIGGKYQALIDAIYHPLGDSDNTASRAVWQAFSNAEQSALRLHLHRAYLSKTIDKALYEALLTLASGEPAYYQGSPIRCAFMNIFDVTLTGALVIGVVPSPERLLAYDPLLLPYKGVLVTYLPGAPTPLKMHTTVHEVQAYLREQLWAVHVPHLRALTPERDKHNFISALRDCLQPATWNSSTQTFDQAPDPEAWLPVTLQPFTQPFLDELVTQKRQRLKDDALFHAVSTALEDQKTADKRRAYFTGLAFNALALGGFFVPGLGQLMLGLTAIQLSYEVFEGIDLWAKGDRQQALSYLMDVVDNVALTVALSAAGGGAEGGTPAVERIPVEMPSFIDELRPVKLPSGEDRLWWPDLQPFAHDIVLPAGLEPDEFGLYHYEGKTWLALEDKTYSVKHSPASGEYRLLSPSKSLSYEPPLRHNGAGAWLHELDRPREWQGMALFRRLGHLSAAFSEETALQILRISNTDESVLRRVLSEQQRLPALLEDTLQRFKLDLEIRHSLPNAPARIRRAEFQRRYRALPASQVAGAAVIQRVYPNLPAPITEELLRNASPSELQTLIGAKVPRRLAEEIHAYQQHVRLTRAYEGVYLESVHNPDSDILILHTLEHIPGWPTDIRIEMHEGKHLAGLIDSVGPDQAKIRKKITRAPDGYVASDMYGSSYPIILHDTLYDALHAALPEAHREALGTSGVSSAIALREQIRQVPQLPRWILRRWLGMQRQGFRAPMRLADGRLGYPLSGRATLSDDISRQTLLDMIRTLELPEHTSRSAEDILLALEGNGLTRVEINARLRQVESESNALQTSLDEWRAQPGTTAHLGRLLSSRLEISNALWRQWSESALPEIGGLDAPLRLEQTYIAEFPQHLPGFSTSRVRRLQLIDVPLETSSGASEGWTEYEGQLAALFQHFPRLQSLEINRTYDPFAAPSGFSSSLALIVNSFPMLRELTLSNQNIVFYALDVERLQTLSRLERLELSGNRLSQWSTFNFNRMQLNYLGLDRMTFDRWPNWLSRETLEHIGTVSLRDNRITALPDFLLRNEINTEHHSVISLQGNIILADQLERLQLSNDGRPRQFSFNVDVPAALQGRLIQLREEQQQVHDAVDGWVNTSSSSAPPSADVIQSRNQVATAILDYWATQSQGELLAPLRLTDIALEDFPRQLPALFYQRVRNMVLTRVRASASQIDQFLRRFQQLNELTFEGHVQPMVEPPWALLELPSLSRLALRDQGLVIEPQVMQIFSLMGNLAQLDLSGNRLVPFTQGAVELPQHLRRLNLSNTQLRTWPSWVEGLQPLDLLDLSGNHITELPEHILDNPRNEDSSTAISLVDNPLSHASMRRAHLSQGDQSSYSFDMDLPEDILELSPPGDGSSSNASSGSNHVHSPIPYAPGDTPNVEAWLLGTVDENESHRRLWQQLEQFPSAENLLALVGRLRQAAPYRNQQSRIRFSERVWRVLGLAATNSDELTLFNAMAQDALVQPDTGAQTCHDGALLVFNQIETHVFTQQSLSNVPQAERGQHLYQLIQRLYRLQELDNIARQRGGNRDEAEVRLAYRLHLAEDLKLPLAPDSMLYEVNAQIDQTELHMARSLVLQGERGESFLNYAAANEHWTQYLRETYTARFTAVEESYQKEVNAMIDRFEGVPLDDLSDQFKALEADKQRQEQKLIHELTIEEGLLYR